MSKNKDLRQAVNAELEFDPFVDSGDIAVSGHGGSITLKGTVPSYPQYLEAVAAAQRVDGVTKVHNHLEVWLPDGDYRDDSTLTTSANNALRADVTVPLDVEAKAKNGIVTLSGTVSYGSQRDAAAEAVTYLHGVCSIVDDIRVWSAGGPGDVVEKVQTALDRNALIPDDSDVVVDVDDTTVSLVGHVRTWAEHDAVVDAAWRADGVFDVRDDLVITG